MHVPVLTFPCFICYTVYANTEQIGGCGQMNKIYACYPGGYHKALTMSYDDGKLADRRLVEILTGMASGAPSI